MAQSNTVTIMPDPQTGKVLRKIGEFGNKYYLVLQSSEMVHDGYFIKLVKRIAIIKGGMEHLQKLLSTTLRHIIQGKLVIIECVESNLPEDWIKEKEEHLKKMNGKIYTKDGERIFRKTVWDPTGLLEDVYVKHNMLVRMSPKKALYSMESTTGEARYIYDETYLIQYVYIKPRK